MTLAATLNIHDGGFTWYVIGLAFSAVIQLVLAWFGLGMSNGARVFCAAFGVVFLGYAIYLAFFFESGAYQFHPYAIAVPVLYLINVYRHWSERRKAALPAE
jgi:hypothetical protein